MAEYGARARLLLCTGRSIAAAALPRFDPSSTRAHVHDHLSTTGMYGIRNGCGTRCRNPLPDSPVKIIKSPFLMSSVNSKKLPHGSADATGGDRACCSRFFSSLALASPMGRPTYGYLHTHTHTHMQSGSTTCNSTEVHPTHAVHCCGEPQFVSPPGHVRAPQRVPEPASGWLRGLTVPVDHHKLIACSAGLCVTAGHGGSVRAWPAPRPRFNCGLGSSGSSHVFCEGPTVRGPCPQYLVDTAQ